MKKVFLLLLVAGYISQAFSQSPEKMSYQAVVRDVSGNLVTNQTVGMKISILQSSLSGAPVFVETHTPLTNANGLISIEIGEGTVVSGSFVSIDWSAGPYFIKSETDPSGGTSYNISGVSQLLSVPYALYAKTAESLSTPLAETDPVFGAWDKDYYDLINTPNIADSISTLVDGSETKLVAGTDITISGSGTTATPYIVNAVGIPSFDFYLGQDTLGGIVYYLYRGEDGQQHGLIVSTTESPIMEWQSTTSVTNATRSWDGVYNMSLLTNSPIKNWVTTNFSSNWYIPSVDELSILWHNRFHVNKTLSSLGLPLLTYSNYWSCTETSSTNAYSFSFSSGSVNGSSKFGTYAVRAIRTF